MTWDLFDAPQPPEPEERGASRGRVVSNRVRPLTVAGVNALARGILESSYPPLWVAGEVTGWKRAPTGHCYFTLRDRTAQIRCVMFQSDAARLPIAPDEGMQVRALGTLTLYEQRGDFQLKVRVLEGEGAGGLWRVAFEKLRRKLEEEGLLAAERKRPLPRHPATVGIVTSPVGAALHDILEVLRKRAPWTEVVFSPARVQGEGAARDIARAIRLFARANVADVLIVGRGGGSTEDLWAFNEEIVARAIAASPVPIISAVGHEVDVTIADLVADVRAPTPSAAAERAVPDRSAILRELAAWDARLVRGLERRVTQQRQRLDSMREDMAAAFDWRLRETRTRLAAAAGRLEALSPLAALRRGYSVVTDDAGHVLRSVANFEPGARVNVRVQDGVVICRVDSTGSRDDER